MTAPFLTRPIPVLLGTTPPLKRSQPQRKEELFKHTVNLVHELAPRLDGVVVYDVWEGNERGKFRTKYGDNRPFAAMLRDATGKDPVVCNVVVHHDGIEGFSRWLDEAVAEDLRSHVYIGASTEKFPAPGPHPREAYKFAANRFGGKVTTGAITIPWRFQEARRLAKKVELGARFALSQITLEAESGKQLVTELEKLCAERDLEPPTIFWNFAPVPVIDVAQEDFDFFEVFPPPENPAAHRLAQTNWDRILLSRDPLRESIEVAAENLEVLLEHSLASRVRPGITAEGMGLQNLQYVGQLCRRLLEVRDQVVKRHYRLA